LAPASGCEYAPSPSEGTAANFREQPGFAHSWFSGDEERRNFLSGKIPLTASPFGGTPDEGRNGAVIIVERRCDSVPSTAGTPRGGFKQYLVLLIELQSLTEKRNGFLPRTEPVAALEISHRMRTQASQCCEFLL
jgi:hypothetical protein